MTKLQQAFQSGFKKEAQGMSRREALRRRIAQARKAAQSNSGGGFAGELGDDFFRGAGIGGTIGAGLGYFKGSMFNKGALGGILGGATLASDNIIDSFQ